MSDASSDPANGGGGETPAPGVVALVCRDLLFGSKVSAAARAVGATLRTTPSCAGAARLGGTVRLVLIDLGGRPEPGAIAELRAACPAARIVCFGSHVHVEALRAARAEGADEALPNSAFVQRLDELLAPLAPGAAPA